MNIFLQRQKRIRIYYLINNYLKMSDDINDDSSIYESKYNIFREDDYLGDIDESNLNEKKKLEKLKKNKEIKSLLKKRKRKIKVKDI